MHQITKYLILILTNRQCYQYLLHYLNLITIVKLLKLVKMWVNVSRVGVTPSINNHTTYFFTHKTLNMKQMLSLIIFIFLNFHTKNLSLHQWFSFYNTFFVTCILTIWHIIYFLFTLKSPSMYKWIIHPRPTNLNLSIPFFMPESPSVLMPHPSLPSVDSAIFAPVLVMFDFLSNFWQIGSIFDLIILFDVSSLDLSFLLDTPSCTDSILSCKTFILLIILLISLIKACICGSCLWDIVENL